MASYKTHQDPTALDPKIGFQRRHGFTQVGMNSDRMAISAAQRAKAGKALGTVIVTWPGHSSQLFH